MRIIKGLLFFPVAAVLLSGVSLAQPIPPMKPLSQKPSPEMVVKMKAANTELNKLAWETAQRLMHPGFRGLIRAQIAKSKKREHILEFEGFLNKTVGGPGAPGLTKELPALKQLQATLSRTKKNIRTLGVWEQEGLDVYFPVQEHRKKWKGGNDLLVAFRPVDDEKEVTEILAYSVKTGKPVTLDPKKTPDTPVLLIAPEEHRNHEAVPLLQTSVNPLPTGWFPDAQSGNPNVRLRPIGTYWYEEVGLQFLYLGWISDPDWYEGAIELELMTVMFNTSDNTNYSIKWHPIPPIDQRFTWYYTYNYTRRKIETNDYGYMYVELVERDGGVLWDRHYHYPIADRLIYIKPWYFNDDVYHAFGEDSYRELTQDWNQWQTIVSWYGPKKPWEEARDHYLSLYPSKFVWQKLREIRYNIFGNPSPVPCSVCGALKQKL